MAIWLRDAGTNRFADMHRDCSFAALDLHVLVLGKIVTNMTNGSRFRRTRQRSLEKRRSSKPSAWSLRDSSRQLHYLYTCSLSLESYVPRRMTTTKLTGMWVGIVSFLYPINSISVIPFTGPALDS